MGNYSVISSDAHVIEPPDLWAGRMDQRFGDRAPRLVYEEDADWWYVDDRKTSSFQAGTQVGVRFDRPETLKCIDKWENVRPGGYLPEEHVKDLDLDGVDGTVLYPTQGLFVYRMRGLDGSLLSAICSAYNDWLVEFCSGYPDRLKGIAMINVEDIPGAIKELERTRKLGLVGALITVYPDEDKSFDLPQYDPFWAAAQDLAMPLSFHIGTNRPVAGEDFKDQATARPALVATLVHWVKVSIAHMVFSEVFVRYPGLRVVSLEHELSWIPYFLDQLDYTYTQRAHRAKGWPRFKDDMVPSDFFRRSVLASFQEDERGLRDKEIIGADNLMWGSDYPHMESTFPRTREILERIFAGISHEDEAKIVCGNAARLYGFN